MIGEEKLMAYVDGEIAEADRAFVEDALRHNGRGLEALARERRLRTSIVALYDPALHEEVPERLTRLLGSPAHSRPAAPPFASGRDGWWRNVTAIAATLVLGIFLGFGVASERSSPAIETAYVADRALGRALDVQLASTQNPGAPIQIGTSFVDREGVPCRSFRTSGAVGLACRDGGRWALKLVAPFKRSGAFEYQQAASTTTLIMPSVQDLMAGDPMDAIEERRARDSGWATRPR